MASHIDLATVTNSGNRNTDIKKFPLKKEYNKDKREILTIDNNSGHLKRLEQKDIDYAKNFFEDGSIPQSEIQEYQLKPIIAALDHISFDDLKRDDRSRIKNAFNAFEIPKTKEKHQEVKGSRYFFEEDTEIDQLRKKLEKLQSEQDKKNLIEEMIKVLRFNEKENEMILKSQKMIQNQDDVDEVVSYIMDEKMKEHDGERTSVARGVGKSDTITDQNKFATVMIDNHKELMQKIFSGKKLNLTLNEENPYVSTIDDYLKLLKEKKQPDVAFESDKAAEELNTKRGDLIKVIKSFYDYIEDIPNQDRSRDDIQAHNKSVDEEREQFKTSLFNDPSSLVNNMGKIWKGVDEQVANNDEKIDQYNEPIQLLLNVAERKLLNHMMNQEISNSGNDGLPKDLSSVNKTEELIKLIPKVKTAKDCENIITQIQKVKVASSKIIEGLKEKFPSILDGVTLNDLITSGKKQKIHKKIIDHNLDLLKFIVFMLVSISSKNIDNSGRSTYAAKVFNQVVIPVLQSILSDKSVEVDSLQSEEEFLKDKGLQKETTMTSDKEEIAVYYYPETLDSSKFIDELPVPNGNIIKGDINIKYKVVSVKNIYKDNKENSTVWFEIDEPTEEIGENIGKSYKEAAIERTKTEADKKSKAVGDAFEKKITLKELVDFKRKRVTLENLFFIINKDEEMTELQYTLGLYYYKSQINKLISDIRSQDRSVVDKTNLEAYFKKLNNLKTNIQLIQYCLEYAFKQKYAKYNCIPKDYTKTIYEAQFEFIKGVIHLWKNSGYGKNTVSTINEDGRGVMTLFEFFQECINKPTATLDIPKIGSDIDDDNTTSATINFETLDSTSNKIHEGNIEFVESDLESLYKLNNKIKQTINKDKPELNSDIFTIRVEKKPDDKYKLLIKTGKFPDGVTSLKVVLTKFTGSAISKDINRQDKIEESGDIQTSDLTEEIRDLFLKKETFNDYETLNKKYDGEAFVKDDEYETKVNSLITNVDNELLENRGKKRSDPAYKEIERINDEFKKQIKDIENFIQKDVSDSENSMNSIDYNKINNVVEKIISKYNSSSKQKNRKFHR